MSYVSKKRRKQYNKGQNADDNTARVVALNALADEYARKVVVALGKASDY